MSFTTEIKLELCRIPVAAPCCALAECLGMLLYAARCDRTGVRLQAESPAVRRRCAALLRQLFAVSAEDDGGTLTLAGEEAAAVLSGFGYEDGALQLNRALVEEECDKSSFLRGAFLAGGYVSTSGKGYHLELVTARYRVAQQVRALLLDLEQPAAYIQRRGNHVLYYKNSTHIEEFLTAAGATGSAMELMLKKVERELRNRVNRQVNCETANLGKTLDAAARQLSAIAALRARGALDALPAPLRETAALRERYPESSLSELCALHETPISRPGLNARLRKLVSLAEEEA